jgi:hypothetical protein
MAVAFDTFKFAKMLQSDGGFTPEQSERLTYALSDLLLNASAAKSDLEIFADKDELVLLASKADLAEAKFEIFKWMVGMFAITLGIIEGAALAGIFR